MRSEEEMRFYAQAELLPAILGIEGNVVAVIYEPFKIRVASGWYTPDFLVCVKNSNKFAYNIIVEVKGSKEQTGYRSGRQKFIEACNLYRDIFSFVFVLDGKVEVVQLSDIWMKLLSPKLKAR